MLKEKSDESRAGKIAGWSLILWGIHKADYPFFRTVSWFAPWGYIIASILFLIAAFGKLLAYYEKNRLGMIKLMEERRKIEEQAIESERKLRTLFSNLQGMAYRCKDDQDWTMSFLSEGCSRLTGYSPAQLIENKSLSYNDLIHPEDREAVKFEVEDALDQKLPFKISYRIRTASGEEKWVYEQGVEVSQEEDGSRILEGYITDITNMEDAQKGLNEQLHLLMLSSEVGKILSKGSSISETLTQCCKSLVQHLDAAFTRIWLLDEKKQDLELMASAGLYTHIDGKHSRIPLGENKIAFIAREKKPLFTNTVIGDPLIHDQEWAKREKMASFSGHPLMVSGKVVGVVALFARHRLTNIVLKALASVADGIAMAIVRKRADEALQAERDFISVLINITPAFVVTLDSKGQVLMMNQTMLDTTGYSEEEVLGKNYIVTFIPEDEHEELKNIFYILITLKKPTLNEHQIICKNGSKHDVLFHGQPILKPDGELDFFFGVALDITERKKAAQEKKELEKQLQQAQKMEALGTLAGGIAHDFNNILTAINGYTELAYYNIENPVNLKRDLDEIKKGAERAKNLVKQILTFSRKTERETRPLQISLVIKEALKLLRSSIPTTIDIQQDIDSKALVLADPTEIHQIVMNLCTNAYHAMRETGGTLNIFLKEIEISKPREILDSGIEAGKYLRFEVIDTGSGIDEELKEKIFEPYYTTKSPGEGTGLGLAVVHGIVTSIGGSIEVDTVKGEGTTFRVYFPVFEGERENTSSTGLEVPLKGGNERIILVDDDINVIDITRRTLKKYGYKIQVFHNGMEAYKEFEGDPDKYDLIITDMTMPYMTGAELSKKILEIRPNFPIILWTGHSELINSKKALALGIREYYYKPLTATEILLVVRKVLDNATAAES